MNKTEKRMKAALDELNCTCSYFHCPDDYKYSIPGNFCYHFQGRPFVICAIADKGIIRLDMKCELEFPTEELSLLAMVTNQINAEPFAQKMTYEFDELMYRYQIRITAITPLLESDVTGELLELMEGMFEMERRARNVYDQYKEWYGTWNPQEKRDRFLRENRLEGMHMLDTPQAEEILHRDPQDMIDSQEEFEALRVARKKQLAKKVGKRFDPHNIAAFSPLIRQILPQVAPDWTMTDVASMKILCDECTEVSDLDTIAWQPLLAPMVNDWGKKARIRQVDCTYVLTSMEGHTLVMHIRHKGGNERYLLFNLNVLCDSKIFVDRDDKHLTHPVTNLLIAVDKKGEEQRRAEFNYMSEDALDRLLERGESDCTMEQRAMLLSGEEEEQKLLYFGTQAFLEGRFVQALPPLLSVLRAIDKPNASFTRLQKESYHRCLYMIGYCMNELKQFDRALYYLQKAQPGNRINYSKEYIYALRQQHSPALLEFLVHERMTMIDEIYYQEEAAASDQRDYLSYLGRCIVDELICQGAYKEARKLLEEEIREGRNQSFADDRLKIIRRKEEE